MSAAAETYGLFVNGRWMEGSSKMPVQNPANEEQIAEVAVASEAEVNQALETAREAQREWGRRTGVKRGNFLRRLADLVERDRERLARVISNEEGKPIGEALGEVDFGNSWFRYYAEFDRRIEGEILPADKPTSRSGLLGRPWASLSELFPGIIRWRLRFERLRPR